MGNPNFKALISGAVHVIFIHTPYIYRHLGKIILKIYICGHLQKQ